MLLCEQEEELYEFDEHEQELRDEWEVRNKKHQIAIAEMQCVYRTADLGRDR